MANGTRFDFYKSTVATQTVKATGKTFHFPALAAAAFVRKRSALGDKSKPRSPGRSKAAKRSAGHEH